MTNKEKYKCQTISEFLEWLEHTKNYKICSLGESGYGGEEYLPIFTFSQDLIWEFSQAKD